MVLLFCPRITQTSPRPLCWLQLSQWSILKHFPGALHIPIIFLLISLLKLKSDSFYSSLVRVEGPSQVIWGSATAVDCSIHFLRIYCFLFLCHHILAPAHVIIGAPASSLFSSLWPDFSISPSHNPHPVSAIPLLHISGYGMCPVIRWINSLNF